MDVMELRRSLMIGTKPPQIITPTPGPLITFDTDMAVPLNSCIINFLPVQAGSGNPTPDNVRPISGWTGIEVYVSPTLQAEDGVAYPISWVNEYGTVYGGYIDLINGVLCKKYQYISLADRKPVTYGASSYDGTLGTNAMYYISDTGLHYSGSPKVFADKVKWAGRNTWENPNNFIWQYCINAGEQLHVVFDNETVGITSDMTFAQRRSAIYVWTQNNPMIFVLPLKNPITYQLTPTQIKALHGTNNIWSDSNSDIELSYITH